MKFIATATYAVTYPDAIERFDETVITDESATLRELHEFLTVAHGNYESVRIVVPVRVIEHKETP